MHDRPNVSIMQNNNNRINKETPLHASHASFVRPHSLALCKCVWSQLNSLSKPANFRLRPLFYPSH